MVNCLKTETVENLPEEWLQNIPHRDYYREVYLIVDNTRSETGHHVTKILNSRFVYSQLGIELQPMTKRQIWYIVDQKLNGLDLSGSKKQQYISLSEMVKNFCEKLTDFYGVPYWGLVLDDLYVSAKARATILDLDGTETGLNAKTFPKFSGAPFFFLICEKEDTLKSMLNELKKRGYTCGFYGIITQGYGSTNVIRLLMQINRVSKFYVFVAHDYDIDGLKIFFDLKRYFPCESVGINPTFLNTIPGVDRDGISQDYSGRSGNAKKSQMKGAINMINGLFGSTKKDKFDDNIKDPTYIEYRDWIEGCAERKIELDALLAYRLNNDINMCKSRDLVNYIEIRLNDGTRVYNLNRYKKPKKWDPEEKTPEVTRPKIIDDTIEELKEFVVKPIKEYLKDRGMENDIYWKELVDETFEEFKEEAEDLYEAKKDELEDLYDDIIDKNKDYEDSLTAVEEIIQEQDMKIYDFSCKLSTELEERVQEQILILRNEIKGTEIYQRVRRRLNKFRNRAIESLNAPENRQAIIESVLTDLKAFYMTDGIQEESIKILNSAIKKLESVV